jgi:uncharacterized protein (TIGR02594 family)
MTAAYIIALNEISTSEIKGVQHNPKILEYFTATSLTATSDETAWCAAFVNWCLKQAGVSGTNSARTRSFMAWGRGVHIDEAKQGDIVVFANHVGFFAGKVDDTTIHVLGGNQSNSVTISRYNISSILSIRTEEQPMNTTVQTQLANVQPPTIWQWISAAPTIVEKISRLIHTAQTKNLATTIAALVALLTYIAKLIGLDISPEIQDAINTAVIGIIGWFTGKQVINPTFARAAAEGDPAESKR